MTKPHDRRFAAIDATVSQFLNDEYQLRADVARETVAAAIRPLADLGRSNHWFNAVRTWESMVLDTEFQLGWALLEGSTRAVHAA